MSDSPKNKGGRPRKDHSGGYIPPAGFDPATAPPIVLWEEEVKRLYAASLAVQDDGQPRDLGALAVALHRAVKNLAAARNAADAAEGTGSDQDLMAGLRDALTGMSPAERAQVRTMLDEIDKENDA